MITLVRPQKSKLADKTEKRLKKMFVGYNTVYKEVSDITYLVFSGQVFTDKGIEKFLKGYKKELRSKNIVPSDDREIG